MSVETKELGRETTDFSEPQIIQDSPGVCIVIFLICCGLSFFFMGAIGDRFTFSAPNLISGADFSAVVSLIMRWRKITLTKDRQTYRGLFGTRSILRKDIALVTGTDNSVANGITLTFTTNEWLQTVSLEAKDGNAPKVILPYRYLYDKNVRNWLSGLPDADQMRDQERLARADARAAQRQASGRKIMPRPAHHR